MNFLTRAFKSLKARKGKSFIIFTIMTTICMVILTSFSIQTATEVASIYARQKLGAEVSLTVDNEKMMQKSLEENQGSQSDGEPTPGGKRFSPQQYPIPLEYLNELKDSQYVTDYYIKSSTSANLGDDLVAVGAEESEESTEESNQSRGPQGFGGMSESKMMNNGDVTLSGVNSLAMDSKVKAGTIELISGETITDEDIDTNVVMVEESFATQNELEIGDKFTITNVNEDIEAELEIIGIYKDSSEIDSHAFRMTSILPYNNLYVPYTVANKLKGENYDNAVDSIVFSINDPVNIDSFIKESEATSIDFETYKLDAGDKAYESLMGPIENVASFSKTTLILVTVFGGTILSLIVMLLIKERVFEIGILMSLGERRFKIIGQLIAETTLVLIMSLVVSGLFGNVISSKVANNLIQKEIATQTEQNAQMQSFQGIGPGGFGSMDKKDNIENVDPIDTLDVKVSGKDFAKMSLSALILSIIATMIPSLFIMRLNPKNILSRHN